MKKSNHINPIPGEELIQNLNELSLELSSDTDLSVTVSKESTDPDLCIAKD